jgi:hypothetical protein
LSTSQPDPRRTSSVAVDAVAGAYYANEVGAAAAARERAQRSYTIAGALATTLLAAGAFTGLADRSATVKAVGLLALVLWALAAALYGRAISTPITRLEGEALTAEGFVAHALEVARQERDAVDARLRVAQICALLACAATFAVLVLAFFVPAERTGDAVLLSERGRATVALACSIDPANDALAAGVESGSLSGEYVRVHIRAGACERDAEVELLLPKADVVGVKP